MYSVVCNYSGTQLKWWFSKAALYYNLLTNKMPCFSAAITYTEGQVISPIRFPANKGSGESISNLGVKESVIKYEGAC